MFAVIEVPDFALQTILRHEPELAKRPLALIDDRESKAAIFQLTADARAAGVHEGLTSTQALARCPAIQIKARSPAQEAVAEQALLQTAFLFSPSIENTASGICTLDLAGLSSAGDETWARKISTALASLHLNARIGVAHDPDLALQAARTAAPFQAVGDSRQFLRDLPIAMLNPSEKILLILQKWGIRNVGAFVDLGKQAVLERLGTDALPLLERAAPSKVRPLRLVRPAETFEEMAEFENEIETLEPLIFILNRFLDQLSRRLGLSGFVAAELELSLLLTDGSASEHRLRVPAPTARTETLFRMLHTHLENLKTDSAIRGLHLVVKPCRPEQHQFGLFEAALRDPNQFFETLARLNALLGPDRVGTPVVEETHRPDAFRIEAVDFQHRGSGTVPLSGPGRTGGLPLRRFRPPIPAVVEVAESRPVYVRSRSGSGRVKQAEGPWRSSGDWWDAKGWGRDEWDVQLSNGELYRLHVEGEDWFIDGIFS